MSFIQNFPTKSDTIQYTTMPTASATNAGDIVQYTGTSTETYTNGYFYKCVENSGSYSWEQTDVQPSGSGSDSKMLTGTLTAANWTDNSQTVAVSGLGANDNGVIGLLNTATDVQIEAAKEAKIKPTTQAENSITFKCENTPSIDIPFGILIGGGGSAIGNPTGTIISLMGKTAPEGYLACDGTTYNIADYPVLANYFKTQFGTSNNFGGNGSTTFAVPDLRGEFLRGTGTNSHSNQGSGASVGTHQDGTIHLGIGVSDNNYLLVKLGMNRLSEYTSANRFNSDSLAPKFLNTYDNCYYGGLRDSRTEEVMGAFTSRPTNTSVLYCIKY